MPKFQFYNLNGKYSSHENNFELISHYLVSYKFYICLPMKSSNDCRAISLFLLFKLEAKKNEKPCQFAIKHQIFPQIILIIYFKMLYNKLFM